MAIPTLGKLTILFSVLLLVACGLCGAAVLGYPNSPRGDKLADLAFFGMVTGAGGLVLTGLAAILLAIFKRKRRPPPPKPL